MKAFTLKDLIKIKNGKDHKQLKEGAIPILGSGGLMRYGDKAIYEKESILLPRKGSLSNIQFSNVPFWTVDTLYYTEVNTQLCNPFYLYNYLKILNLESLNSGTGVPSMTFDSYYNLSIKLPSLVIQNTVSSILWSIEEKIQLNTKLNDNLELMAKTLYDYWFVQFDFPDSNGKPYKTSGGKMVWNEELKREIPLDWKVLPLFDGLDVQYGFPFDTNTFTDDFTQKPVIRIRDILENSISTYSTQEVDEKYRLNSGDLLIGMDGNFHLNFWDKDGAYLNQRSVRIRPIGSNEISNFQTLFQLTPYIKAREQNVSRTTVGHLSDKDLKRLYVLNAKKTLNFNPKKTLNSMLSKIISNRLQNQELASLRDWLLPMLMNGQVKVQDESS